MSKEEAKEASLARHPSTGIYGKNGLLEPARILSWRKPPKTMTDDEWRAISADGAPPGVYTPNMSRENMARWRAKKIGGSDSRVEIRTVKGSQILLIVRPDGVQMSMNGKAEFSTAEWSDLHSAVREAQDVLNRAIPVPHSEPESPQPQGG